MSRARVHLVEAGGGGGAGAPPQLPLPPHSPAYDSELYPAPSPRRALVNLVLWTAAVAVLSAVLFLLPE